MNDWHSQTSLRDKYATFIGNLKVFIFLKLRSIVFANMIIFEYKTSSSLGWINQDLTICYVKANEL